MAKSVEIEINGRAEGITQAARTAQTEINRLSSETKQLLSSFSGGLIGGGMVAGVLAAANIARTVLREFGAVLIEARRLQVSPLDIGRGRLLGMAAGDPKSIESSIVAARQGRAEALAGDPNFTKAFRDLGLNLAEVAKLNPAELQQAIIDAFRRSDMGKDQREALRALFGEQAGSALEPLAAGGFLSRGSLGQEIAKAIASGVANSPLATGALAVSIPGQSILRGLNGFIASQSQSMDPLPRFGQGDEQRVGMMREINTQRAAEISRAQLTTEQRLNAALQERSRLVQLIEGTVNPIARERLVSRALGVEAEILDLQQKRAGDQAMGKLGIPSTLGASRPTDALRSLGFDLGRLSGSGPNYPQQLVQQGEKHQRTLDEIRGELRKFNE